jgi:hypothetical protein
MYPASFNLYINYLVTCSVVEIVHQFFLLWPIVAGFHVPYILFVRIMAQLIGFLVLETNFPDFQSTIQPHDGGEPFPISSCRLCMALDICWHITVNVFCKYPLTHSK